MAELVYTAITSLDGYVADTDGGFDWAAPDEEVHAFVNDLERGAGTYLYGRRMYETMRFWETDPPGREASTVSADYAQLWRSADKVVFSTTLREVDTARTRLASRFEPDEVRRWKRAADAPLSIGGPGLAAAALRAGLVDELRWIAVPVLVGGGTPWLPSGVRARLELTADRRFSGGAAYRAYRVREERATAGGRR
ncbi:MAG TPA: dihydrofolate reductase family protein [Amnibacterium sp.]|nr:dihydrofolate reductase family protein [Amnibacterium sp.]